VPGVSSMPLDSTYLAWVDFRRLGMEQAEIERRLREGARIADRHGDDPLARVALAREFGDAVRIVGCRVNCCVMNRSFHR